MKKFLIFLIIIFGLFVSVNAFAAEKINSFDAVIKIREDVGFPKGIVIKPSNFEVALETAKDNWIIGLPILTFIACFYLWYTRGRDPKGRGIIIAQYDPPDNLTPAEVGPIVDEHTQNKDITAEIIFLATQGYLKIKQMEGRGSIFKSKDYELELLNNDSNRLNEFQKII